MSDPIYDEAVWAGMYADPAWIANRGTRRVFVTPVGLSRLDEYRNKYGSPESVVPSGKCDVTATFRPAIVDGALTSGTVSVTVTVDAPNIPGPRDSTGSRLVTTRRIKDNDIPDIVNRFHNLKGEESRSRKEQSFLVPVEEIRNNDYDLSINKYKEIEREKVVYDSVETILARLDKSETEYVKGYRQLVSMLEGKTSDGQG